MVFKLKNKQQLNQYIEKSAQDIEKILIYGLEYAVEDLINHAIAHKGYKDQTSNLRSSIGGVVLKDGRPVTFSGFSGSGQGVLTGMEYINSLIAQNSKGYVIIVAAGMAYATYVEDIHGLNVLKKTELVMRKEMDEIITMVKSKMK